ncbi:MAG: hypothetical protein V1890_04065 [Candidatus Zixiibacteriota bacterium]
MGFIAPAGRTSSVNFEGKIFQVQTEFVTRPNPKVVSSIILDGKLIHKVEKIWKGKLNEENQEKLEQFLKKEHESVTRALKKNPFDFLSGEEGFQNQIEKLSLLKEIENPFILRYNGSILYPEKKEDEFLKGLSKILARALRLGQALTDFSEIGEIRSGVLEYPPHKIIWVYYNEKLWGAFLKKGSPIDDTIKTMGNLIQESYE